MENILQFIESNALMIYLLTFASFLGFELISKVPSVLHTPLMSGANAISGIVIVGSILLIRKTDSGNYLYLTLASIALIMAVVNIVGGFAVTNRMLGMFRKKDN